MKKCGSFLLLAFCLLFACSRQNPDHLTIGEFLKDYGYTTKKAQKEIHAQLDMLNRESFTLMGETYRLVHAEELSNKKDSRITKIDFFFPIVKENNFLDSSKNMFVDDYHEKPYRIIEFYQFDVTRNKFFKVEGMSIQLPNTGPFAWPWHQPAFPKMEYEIPGMSYYNSHKRVLHVWNMNGNHYDSYNFNFNDEYFYLSTGMSYVFNVKNNLIVGIPFSFIPYRFSAFKPMKQPVVYRHDIAKQSYDNITIQASPQNGNEAHPLMFLKNPYGGYLYFYAAAPEILFLSDDLDVMESMDLRNVYDKHDLSYHYDTYKYMVPWGDIYNISDRFIVISTPLHHLEDYTLKKGKTLSKTSKYTESTRRHFLGDKKKDHLRLVILIDKKERKVIKSEIFDAGFNYNHQYRTGLFFECEMYFMKDLETIVYFYKYIEPNEKTAQIKYFSSDKPYRYFMSVYKRQNIK
jgi:hypothetical protein